MNPDHNQALILVLGGPLTHVGKRSKPVDARVGPELHRDDASLEPLGRQRLRVEPSGRALERGQAALARQDFRSCLPMRAEESHRKSPLLSRYGARNPISATTISSGACSANQWPAPGPSGVGSRVEVELMPISF